MTGIEFSNSNSPNAKSIQNLFSSFNLCELVNTPTRVTSTSKSLLELDNVVTDMSLGRVSCVYFFQSFSDHEAQIISIKHCFQPVDEFYSKQYFIIIHIDKFSGYVSLVDWTFE